MRFFSNDETRVYFAKISKKLKDEVEKMSDVDITTCDFNEWVEYLYSKHMIVPVTVYEDGIVQSLVDTKVKKYNHFYGSIPYEQEYYHVDGVRIIYEIPFDGEDELFWLQPNSRVLTSFEVEDFNAPNRDKCGSIIMEFEYSKSELENQKDNMSAFVKNGFESRFRSIRTMIGYVNAEVNAFNNNLRKFAMQCLEERKKRASSLSFISQMLEIPLERSDTAPNISPIPLERIVRTPVKKPDSKPLSNEYAIKDFDYENINNIILSCGTAMENTARTHAKNDEEELRDFLLATLNTHYNNASGETFRKAGKTDIRIEFDNKAAFVGECKVWHGTKAFEQAIQQVLSYSTWRDTKISVIVFNKENQSFNGVLEKIDAWVRDNAKSFKHTTANVWDCIYYRVDANAEIRLNILAFDMYVDKA